MTYLRATPSTNHAEPAKVVFQHRPMNLRYGAVQQTAQIAAARDLAFFVRCQGGIPFITVQLMRQIDNLHRALSE